MRNLSDLAIGEEKVNQGRQRKLPIANAEGWKFALFIFLFALPDGDG